jgi:uncharacterized protein YodC (DUF2158 family)
MFKSGDLVRLKSGGPVMTVSQSGSGGVFVCHWFNRDGDSWTAMNAVFVGYQLEAAKAPQPTVMSDVAA